MQTVLHVIDTTGPGGAETVYLEIARGLDPSRFRSIVTTGVPSTVDRTAEGISDKGWLYDALAASGIEPIILPTTRAFDIAYVGRIIALARRERADVIHSHLLTPNVYCALAGMITGIPVVSTFHGWVDVTGRRMTALKLQIVNRGATRVVFVSHSLAQTFSDAKLGDPKKAAVVHNGIDSGKFHPQPNTALREAQSWANATIVGAVGNIRAAKGYDVLLDAAHLALARAPSLRFAIVGDDTDGLRGALERQVERLGLGDRVRFLGFGGDVPEFLNGLDIFVLSSRSEGFSLSTVEAMATGLPVVATRSGGPEEIVEDGVSGLLVPPGSPAALADALVAVCENRTQRLALAAGARDRATRAFDTSAMVRGYEQLYRSL